MPLLNKGAYVAGITPLDRLLNIDMKKLVQHSRWLLEQGASGVLLMGTTGEANSFSVAERKNALEEVLAAGIPADKILVGAGLCNIPEVVELSRHALEKGVTRLLLLPPFYYKNMHNDGLLAFYKKVAQALNDYKFKLYLYHFPAMSGMHFDQEFIAAITRALPGALAGMKDSGGDWEYTSGNLKRFPGFQIFVGNERYLSQNLQAGGTGCITATLNISVNLAAGLLNSSDEQERLHLQNEMNALRGIIEKYPFVPALKFAISLMRKEESWRYVRPPQSPLTADQQNSLEKELSAAGFPERFIKL